MSEIRAKVLILDDDLQVLSAIKRSLRKHFEISAFDNAEAALSALKNEFFPVIISDMRMPVMDGATFLQKSYQISPDSQRILLTGYADIQSTIQAVNQGHIQCYIQKPWNNKELLERVIEATASAEQNKRLTQISKNVDKLASAQEKSRDLYRNVIDFVSQLAGINQVKLMDHNHRISQHVLALGHELNWSKQENLHCYLASLFYSLGFVVKNIDLDQPFYAQNSKVQQLYLQAIEEGAKMMAIFEHLRPVANLVRQLSKHSHTESDEINAPALLKVVIDYDLLIQGKLMPQKLNHEQAIDWLLNNNKRSYCAPAVKLYAKWLQRQLTQGKNEVSLLARASQLLYSLKTNDSQWSFTLVTPVTTPGGSILLTQGQIVNLDKLKHLIDIEQQQNTQLLLNVKKIALCQLNIAS